MPSTRRPLALGLLLVLLVVTAYRPVADAGFIWDDDEYVTDNRNLQDATGLGRIWTDPATSPQYYPLVFTSFWVERQLFGPGPTAHHVTNVALHVLNALLVWAVLARLGVGVAFMTGLVFALHPVHVESVAWITERKNVLSGAFFLAALLAYLSFALPGRDAPPMPSPVRRRLYLLALLLFVCALLSKTVTAVLPAVLLILVWWKRGGVEGRDLRPLVPLGLLGLAFGSMTAWMEVHHVGASGSEWNLGALERVLLAGQVPWFYAGKLAWPHPLIFTYPRWTIDAGDLAQYAWPACTIAVVGSLWVVRHRLGREPLSVVLAFLCLLAPVLGFFNVYPMRYSWVADHFQYLASIAILALALGVAARALALIGVAWLRIVLAAVLIAGLTITTRAECAKYHDAESLWLDTIAKNPDSWLALNNLGTLRLGEGKLPEARLLLESALRVNPGLAAAHNNIGNTWIKEGNQARAVESYSRALDLAPDYVEALSNLGVALGQSRRYPEAIESYRRALRIDSSHVMAHYNLANTLVRLGRLEEANEHYEEAIRLKPDLGMAHYALGLNLLLADRRDEANVHLATAFRLMPDFHQGHTEVARVLESRRAVKPVR